MADILMVYITCADPTEARRIGRVLVEERLAACVNIRPHEAIYRWQGMIEESAEIGMIAKIRREAYPALEARVRALHSYSLPCIVAWALDEGAADYLRWIVDPDLVAG